MTVYETSKLNPSMSWVAQSFSDSLRNLQPSPSMSWVAQVVGVPAAEANVERAELFLGGMPSALDVARPKP